MFLLCLAEEVEDAVEDLLLLLKEFEDRCELRELGPLVFHLAAAAATELCVVSIQERR